MGYILRLLNQICYNNAITTFKDYAIYDEWPLTLI